MDRLEGLSQEEVAKKIQEGKQNKVTIKTEKSVGQIIRDNVFTYFNLIFLVFSGLAGSSEVLEQSLVCPGRRGQLLGRNCAGSPL